MPSLMLPPWPAALPQVVPTLSVPDRIPAPVVVAALAVVLAGLDLGGAVAAKAWAEHRSVVWFGVGLALFGVLFWVYGSALQYAELAEVTIAWIVLLQVGVILLDRFRYAVEVPTSKWVAVIGILGLEAYLLLAPSTVGRGAA